MARFFFNLFNDLAILDEEGMDLPDIGAAKRQARSAAAGLIAEQVGFGKRLNPEHSIEVQDEERRVVYTLSFRELIEQHE